MDTEEIPTVFMAHSSEDMEGPAFFDRLFAAAGVRAYWYPYPSGRTYPHYLGIRKAIEEAKSLFVVLSKPMEVKPQTRSWVSFEVGIAVGLGKPVWVFEGMNEVVNIPVPAAAGYLQRPASTSTLRTFVFGDLVKSAGTSFPEPSSDIWSYARCSNDDCREEFLAYVLNPKTARCPACRQPSTIVQVSAEDRRRILGGPIQPAASKLRGLAPEKPAQVKFVEVGPKKSPTKVPIGIWITRDEDPARFNRLMELTFPQLGGDPSRRTLLLGPLTAIRFSPPRVPAAAFTVHMRWQRLFGLEVEARDIMRDDLVTGL